MAGKKNEKWIGYAMQGGEAVRGKDHDADYASPGTVELQTILIKNFGTENRVYGFPIVVENVVHASKPLHQRPNGAQLSRYANDGYTIVVTSLDRLGQDVREVLGTLLRWQEFGASLGIVGFARAPMKLQGPEGKFFLSTLRETVQVGIQARRDTKDWKQGTIIPTPRAPNASGSKQCWVKGRRASFIDWDWRIICLTFYVWHTKNGMSYRAISERAKRERIVNPKHWDIDRDARKQVSHHFAINTVTRYVREATKDLELWKKQGPQDGYDVDAIIESVERT